MLAPMQGLTNRALRQVFADTAQPDVLFTEFVRVRPRYGKKKLDDDAPLVTNADLQEAVATAGDIPLVVQVIGSIEDGAIDAVKLLVDEGVQHINVNMGCPWGRMTSVLAGGGMFKAPETVFPLLSALRKLVPGTLSVKTRAGLDDERQLFGVLPAFADAGLDFLVLHARTVQQKYKGDANHALTAELVDTCPYPIIANGDVRTAEDADHVLQQTHAAGLMLGRGAIADVHLFQRIRGERGPCPTGVDRQRELAAHFSRLLTAFEGVFCGDTQVLHKLKESLAHVEDADQKKFIKRLKKARQVADAHSVLRDAMQQTPVHSNTYT